MDIVLKQETPSRVAADIPEISFQQLKTVLDIVWKSESPPKEFRINNTIFYPNDTEVLINQSYEAMQWKVGRTVSDEKSVGSIAKAISQYITKGGQ